MHAAQTGTEIYIILYYMVSVIIRNRSSDVIGISQYVSVKLQDDVQPH
jgi:hypothetical protein